MITQERLKELLKYHPKTGLFSWKESRGDRIKKGEFVGCIDKSSGYIKINIDNKSYRAHRLAWLYMKGYWPREIDHIKHIKSDNRWSMLREVGHGDNQKNRSKYKNNKSGISGVNWHSRDSIWQSYIRENGKLIYLGRFIDFFEACCARKSAEYKYGFHENHGRNYEANTKDQAKE